MAVVVDDAFGYGAILGSEWLDDKWEESDGTYKNLPQYDKLYHIRSASSIIKNSNESLQDAIADSKSILTHKEVNEKKAIEEKLPDDYREVVKTIEEIAESNLDKCYDGKVIEVQDCTERQSLMLFMKYFVEYCKRQYLTQLSHTIYQIFDIENDDVEDDESGYEMKGVEIYIDGDFAARITMDDPSKPHSVVRIHSNKADGMELHYNGLHNMSDGLYELLSHKIETVPDISVIPSAYDVNIFTLAGLCIDQLTRYNKGIDEEGYVYLIYACETVYVMTLYDSGGMQARVIDFDEITDLDNVDSLVILNEEDSKDLLEMLEKKDK
jgi:hypothetical protein